MLLPRKENFAVNGMSYHSRNGDNANSAIVVTVTPEDFREMMCLPVWNFRENWKRRHMKPEMGRSPVQLYRDFCKKQVSESLGETIPSMKGAWTFGNVRDCFPKEIGDSIEQSVKVFGRKIRGFDRGGTILSAVESRTSSPCADRAGKRDAGEQYFRYLSMRGRSRICRRDYFPQPWMD